LSRKEISERSNRPQPEVRRIVEFLVEYDMMSQDFPETKYRLAKDLRKFMEKIEQIELSEKT
jgi:DNA-binding IclR family transcriptional regulator